MTTDINSILNSSNSAYSQQQAAKTSGSDLTQSDFLRLMATQLRSQDPSQPMDPSSFFNQLTQFSLVNGMQGLQTSFNTLAQTLQANSNIKPSDLLGHKIMFQSSSAMLGPSGASSTGPGSGTGGGNTLEGAVAVPANATSVTVQIKDASGTVVKTIDLGAPSAGTTDFTWNGQGDNGGSLPAGKYSISATAMVGGAPQTATTYTSASVEGVSLGANGSPPMIDVGALGQIPMSSVFEII
ncbi:MAG TPA: FlgD immunoglobulin-like domain containing protein [Rhodanobacteraceae bacterium]|nr:FlgD immunoglobulin-like domain containing protein [Rhodanobacteraceae bacterium]